MFSEKFFTKEVAMFYVDLDQPEKIDSEKVDLSHVTKLLDYLHSLQQTPCQDRELTWAEDSRACLILLAIPHKPLSPHYKSYIDDVSAVEKAKWRTLETWYRIARSVAHLIQTDRDCDC